MIRLNLQILEHKEGNFTQSTEKGILETHNEMKRG